MTHIRREIRWLPATVAITAVVWLVLRIWLFWQLPAAQRSPDVAFYAFALGLVIDAATLAWCVLPWLMVSAVLPNRLRLGRSGDPMRWITFAGVVALLIFNTIAEIVFWNEFSDRFNFIAVDYLVYTSEVLGNIWQSYPVGWLLSLTSFVAAAVVLAARWRWRWRVGRHTAGNRLLLTTTALLMVTLSGLLPAGIESASENAYANALAGNGLYSLFAAYRHNELDFNRFYATQTAATNAAVLAHLDVRSSARNTVRPQLPAPWWRRPKNVVLITVESLSAIYLGSYGNPHKLTPALDELAGSGLRYGNVFAAGTRTVRGLEALSLAIPPLPGQSLIHRPGNGSLTTLGMLLRAQGYVPMFIYGGYGLFDNMNAYFASNGYEVMDRTDFPESSIAAENIWGVADESLFDNALQRIDRAAAEGAPVLAHIMTTSNHRPYTFPEGRIDREQGRRTSAVAYSDYAIGRFIDQAKTRAWFADTLFVITGDHCAAVAGQTRLPLEDFRVPLIFYGPQIISKATDDTIVSQIDIVPTILDVLGASGRERFFGQSLLDLNRPQRAFVSTYQDLGYYKDDVLTVLSPRQQVRAYAIEPQTYHATPTKIDTQLRTEAIALFQSAADAWRRGELKVH